MIPVVPFVPSNLHIIIEFHLKHFLVLQKQAQNYQLQIHTKKQNQEELITYTQPKSENDDLIIEKLKAIVNEIARSKNKLVEENTKLREDLKMYQNQCQVVIVFLL